MHHKLRQVPYQDIAGLQALASDSAETLQGHLIATAIASRGKTSEDMELHLEEEILVASPKITRMLWVLDTAVTIAPLLGLFGTIVGMIQAFSVLKDASGASKVTGGIADALISPIAVYFVNYFNTISREIMHQLDLIKLVLINHLHGKGGHRRSRGASGTHERDTSGITAPSPKGFHPEPERASARAAWYWVMTSAT